MPQQFTAQELTEIPRVLSTPRFATFLAAAGNNVTDAMRLYQWNAQISASFLFPLHIFEICIRNAIANALESRYPGGNWPWQNAFETSLPNPGPPYFSPRHEITKARTRHNTVGKIIADIKFAFWVSMLTGRHDGRLWQPYLSREFPNKPAAMTVGQVRTKIHKVADEVRDLRNRIAHHEPIFQRTLADDYTTIKEIVGYRCAHTVAWMNRTQNVLTVLAERPF